MSRLHSGSQSHLTDSLRLSHARRRAASAASRRLGPAACLHLIRGLHADIGLAQQQWAVVQLAAGAAGFALPEGRLFLIGGLC